MKLSNNQYGSMNVLLIPLILSILFFFGAAGFGFWAFTEREDYKNNSDQKAAAAVKVAEDKLSSEKDNEFLEREKEPLREYKSPAVFGNISFLYPKTWSGYIKDTDEKLELLMNPQLVSGNDKSVYALRVMVETENYDQVLRRYESKVKTGEIKASAFRLEKVKGILGSRLDGEIKTGVNGSLVLIPLRDKTMIISTESVNFVKDFDKIILPSFSFTP